MKIVDKTEKKNVVIAHRGDEIPKGTVFWGRVQDSGETRILLKVHEGIQALDEEPFPTSWIESVLIYDYKELDVELHILGVKE